MADRSFLQNTIRDRLELPQLLLPKPYKVTVAWECFPRITDWSGLFRGEWMSIQSQR